MKYQIPKSNPIRFVRTDSTAKPNMDNQFHYDQKWTKTWTKNNYFQKFNITDPIHIQLTSDYNTVELKLHTFNMAVAATYTPSTLLTYADGRTRVLQFKIDTALLGGKYYFTLHFSGVGMPSIEIPSEWISIDNYSDLTYLQWKNSDTDGILWDNSIIMGFRIESFWANHRVVEDIEEGEDYAKAPILLRAQCLRQIELKTSPIPFYVCEILALATSHEQVLINDVVYSTKDKSDQETDEGTGLWVFNRILYEKDYENYTNFVQETLPPEDKLYWAYSDIEGDIVTYTDNAVDKVLIY